MKKILFLLLTVALCFSLCACGNGGKSSKGALTKSEGIICIKRSKFPDLLERVELTTENWREHIRVVTYDEEIVQKDPFGEIVSSETVTRHCLSAGNEKYHQFQDALLELKIKATGETFYVSFMQENEWYDTGSNSGFEFSAQNNSVSVSVTEDFNLDDYECIRAQGRLYYVDLPEEAVHSPLPDWYQHGFLVVSSGWTTPYEINPYTKSIRRNGSGSWDEL